MKKETKKAPIIRFRGFTDDWEQRKVGEFYDFKNGLNKNKEFFGKGVPIVNFTDVFHNRGLTASQLEGKVTLEPNEIKNYSVEKGDIFFTRTSETIEEIGYPSVMLDTPENTVFSGFVLRGRCLSGNEPLDNLFKQYVFFTQSFRDEMKKKSSMTTRALTSGTSIKEMLFHFPSSKNEQHQIGKYITKFDNIITLHQRKLDHLKTLKKYFLQNMFPAKGKKVPRIRFKGFTGDWEQRKLGNECFEIVAGGDVDKTKLLQDGKYPVIANALTDEGIIGYYANEYRIKAPAVTVTGRGDVGHARARKINFTPVVRLLSVVSKHDVDFLAELINQNDIVLESTGVPQLTVPALANYLLCFPPTIKEEKRIGQYFSQLNHLITLHQRKLEQLQSMKKFMLQNLFI